MDSYNTHQSILGAALLRTTGAVIEFGCGHGSTFILHQFCAEHNRKLVTVESDGAWLSLFSNLATSQHELILTNDWELTLADSRIVGRDYDLAFVDQAPFEARYTTILALKDKVRFILLHDCDYFPEHGIFGVNVIGLNGSEHRGLRTYDDVFKHYKEFFPPEPWPNARTGPPTLLGSDFESCNWEIGNR